LPGTATIIRTASRNFAHVLAPRGRVGDAAVRGATSLDIVAAYPTCSPERHAALAGCFSNLPTLPERICSQFVNFNFLKSTDLHGRVTRSFPPATQTDATRCATVAGQIEGARGARADQGCAVLVTLLAKGWRRWGLPSGAERKSNAHSEDFGF
jgi:hypothetical protein